MKSWKDQKLILDMFNEAKQEELQLKQRK